MYITTEPALVENLKEKLLAAHTAFASLSQEMPVQNTEVIHILSDCESFLNKVFPPNGTSPANPDSLLEDSQYILQQLDKCNEILSRECEGTLSGKAKKLYGKAQRALHEAEDFVRYWQGEEQEVDGTSQSDEEACMGMEEEKIHIQNVQKALQSKLKRGPKIYNSDEFSQEIDWWIQQLKFPSQQKFISPDVANEFLGSLQKETEAISLNMQDRSAQQKTVGNLVKIRNSVGALQTLLLNRVRIDVPVGIRN